LDPHIVGTIGQFQPQRAHAVDVLDRVGAERRVELRIQRVGGALEEQGRAQVPRASACLGRQLSGPGRFRLQVRVVGRQVDALAAMPPWNSSDRWKAQRTAERALEGPGRTGLVRDRAFGDRSCSLRSPKGSVALVLDTEPLNARHVSPRTPSTARHCGDKRHASCAHRLTSVVLPVDAARSRAGRALRPLGGLRADRAQHECVALQPGLDRVARGRAPDSLQRQRDPAGAVMSVSAPEKPWPSSPPGCAPGPRTKS
jgi:hypothetical protein